MIDAQAVSAHLEHLRSLAPNAGTDWLQTQLSQLSLTHQNDNAGNVWITLPGTRERTVVLGSSPQPAPGTNPLDSTLGLVVGLETLKALQLRFQGPPPCGVQLVIWADPGTGSGETAGTPSLNLSPNVAAYLELHLEPETQLAAAGAPLGVAQVSTDAQFTPHPQLTALADEAVRELTGTSASLPAGPASHATAMARLGVATAILYVQHPTSPVEGDAASATRLQLLQAAEAFGRWTESTVHAVAGDQVDLWAREHRVPHS